VTKLSLVNTLRLLVAKTYLNSGITIHFWSFDLGYGDRTSRKDGTCPHTTGFIEDLSHAFFACEDEFHEVKENALFNSAGGSPSVPLVRSSGMPEPYLAFQALYTGYLENANS
jgi:hypothetical protein